MKLAYSIEQVVMFEIPTGLLRLIHKWKATVSALDPLIGKWKRGIGCGRSQSHYGS